MNKAFLVLFAVCALSLSFAEDLRFAVDYSTDMKTATISIDELKVADAFLVNSIVKYEDKTMITDCNTDPFVCDVYVNLTMDQTYILDEKTMPTAKVYEGNGKTKFDGVYIFSQYELDVCKPVYKTEETMHEVYDNKTSGMIKTFVNETVYLYDDCRVTNPMKWQPLTDKATLYKGERYQLKFSFSKTDWMDKADLVPVIFGKEINSWSWWNFSWTKRKPVTVTNPLAWNMYNYTAVPIQITYAASMQVDFDDIRFSFYNASTALEYPLKSWLENKTDSVVANVWVNVSYIPASGSSVIYMYYGNPAASSDWDGNNTFQFFDHFDAPLDTSVWQRNIGWADTASSELQICNTTGHEGISLSRGAVWPVNQHARWFGYVVTSIVSPGFIGWGDSWRDATSSVDAAGIYYYNNSVAAIQSMIKNNAGTGEEEIFGPNINTSLGKYWTNDLIRNSTYNVSLKYMNDTYLNMSHGATSSVPGLLNFTLYDRTSVCISYDWIAIGNYTANGPVDYPTYLFGAEQGSGVPELTVNFSAIDWETNRTWMNASIDLSAVPPTGVVAWLNYSGTLYPAASTTNGSGEYDFYVDFIIPPVNANNTVVSGNWVYQNTSAFGVSTLFGTAFWQNVYWSYYIDQYNVSMQSSEGEQVSMNMTYRNIFNNLDSNSSYATFNGTRYDLIYQGGAMYNSSLYAPVVVFPNETMKSNATWNVTYAGLSYLRNSSNNFTNIFGFRIYNCTGGNVTINYTAMDLDTLTGLPAFNLNAIVTAHATGVTNASFFKTLTFSGVGKQNYSFCIDPGSKSMEVSTTLVYYATGYGTSTTSPSYSGLNSSGHLNVTLYLINTSYGNYYNFVIQNIYGNKIKDAEVNLTTTLSNGTVLTATRYSDLSGSANFFLDNLYTYNISVYSVGYYYATSTFNPLPGGSSSVITLQFSNYTNTTGHQIGYVITPQTYYFNYTFNITAKYYAANTTFAWFSMNVSNFTGASWTPLMNSTNATGGVWNYSVVANRFGIYYVTIEFLENNTNNHFIGTYKYYYVNGSSTVSEMKTAVPTIMSGQTYYILALVVAILAAGFVFQYSESGAGIVGLMVLFIFSYFNPDAAIFMLGTHIVSVMELTVITVFTIAAAYLLKLNF